MSEFDPRLDAAVAAALNGGQAPQPVQIHSLVNVNGQPTPADAAACTLLVDIRDRLAENRDELKALNESIARLEQRFPSFGGFGRKG